MRKYEEMNVKEVEASSETLVEINRSTYVVMLSDYNSVVVVVVVVVVGALSVLVDKGKKVSKRNKHIKTLKV